MGFGLNVLKTKTPKIFCIGCNKTGTTSLKVALKELGYRIGDQTKAELLIDNYINRDFKSIAAYCKTADAFQDVPFSFKHTYLAMDVLIPGSKFILTVRDDERQWYESVIRFQTKMYGKNGQVPTYKELRNANYRENGYVWKVRRFLTFIQMKTCMTLIS